MPIVAPCQQLFVDVCHRIEYSIPMLKKDAIKFYGSLTELAKALGIQKSAVSRWAKLVPLKRAIQLQTMTKGGLKYDLNDYLDQA